MLLITYESYIIYIMSDNVLFMYRLICIHIYVVRYIISIIQVCAL